MHMNVYIGFLFIYFMNSLSMCELKCRVWRRIVTFLSVRDPLFLLTNKRIIKWSTYAESVLMDKHMGDFWILFVCFFYFKQLNKTRRMLLCYKNHFSKMQKCWNWDSLLQHHAVFCQCFVIQLVLVTCLVFARRVSQELETKSNLPQHQWYF